MKIKIISTREVEIKKAIIIIILVLLSPLFITFFIKLFFINSNVGDFGVFDLFNAIYLNLIADEATKWAPLCILYVWLSAVGGSLFVLYNNIKLSDEREFSDMIFDEQGVHFITNNKYQKNTIQYAYNDIESFKMKLCTKWCKSFLKSSTYPTYTLQIIENDLFFNIISQNKIINVKMCGNLKNIYKILDFHSRFNNFSYEFSGDSGTFSEKFEYYKKHGRKELLQNRDRPIVFVLSLILLCAGIFFALQAKDWLTPTFLVVLSFVGFTVLQKDKISKDL